MTEGSDVPAPSRLFHAGEVRLQELFNEQAKAERISFSLRKAFVDRTRRSLEDMTLLVVTVRGAADLDVHFLSGAEGFLTTADATVLVVQPEHPLPAGLMERCRNGEVVGTTGIDFHTGARVRVNGLGRIKGGNTLVVETEEVFPNCRGHVEVRSSVAADVDATADQTTDVARFVAESRILFIASETGGGTLLDVAHRAGPPRFVQLRGDALRYEDYYGNGMYQSLGNLDLYQRATIAVVDLALARGMVFRGSTTLEVNADRSQRWVTLAVDSTEPAVLPPRRWSRVLAPSAAGGSDDDG